MSWIRLPLLLLGVFALSSGVARAQFPAGGGMMPGNYGMNQMQGQAPAKAAWEGGAALYYLGAFSDANRAAVVTTGIGTPDPVSTTINFPSPYRPSSAVWIARNFSGGIGIQARYFFRIEESQELTSTLDPLAGLVTRVTTPLADGLPGGGATFGSPGILLGAPNFLGEDVLRAQKTQNIHATDVELTFNQSMARWAFTFTGGGRYLNFNGTSTASLINEAVPGELTEEQTLVYTRRFNGGGPTMSLLLNAPFGGSALSAFGMVRGSLVVGSHNESRVLTNILLDPQNEGGPITTTSTFNDSRAGVIPIVESELGLELSARFRGAPLILRLAAVSHTYFNAGSPSSRDGNLYLFGAQGSIVLSY